MSQYEDRIDAYFKAVVPSLHPGLEQDLYTAIAELESGDTAHWANLQDPSLDSLTMEQMNSVWLRRVAVCLRNDIEYGALGFSLASCTWEQLNCLLGLHIQFSGSPLPLVAVEYGYDFTVSSSGAVRPSGVWANNPLTVSEFALKVMDYIGEGPGNYGYDAKGNLILSLIDYMRHSLDWQEPTSKYDDGLQPQIAHGSSLNIEAAIEYGIGGCRVSSQVLRQVLRCLAVPSVSAIHVGNHGGFSTWLQGELVAMVGGCDTIQRVPDRNIPAVYSLKGGIHLAPPAPAQVTV